MIFIVHSRENESSIGANLGLDDYSYYFVLKEYIPILNNIGTVIVVGNPLVEADLIYRDCLNRGEYCVYLSFSPPHKTPIELECPVVPVFAWEYSSLPTEVWGEDPRNDWRFVLGKYGCGITHSCYTVSAVREAMRDGFPIISAPAPVWDRFSSLYKESTQETNTSGFKLNLRGGVFDSQSVLIKNYVDSGSKDLFISERIDRCISDNETTLDVKGVVYTSVFNPNDGRKNWIDLLWAFCWAFKDQKNATLIVKLTHHDAAFSLGVVLSELFDLPDFECRVIAIQGYLPDEQYRRLVLGTTYIVNSSHGEGQCLPLMEYMSAGKPAVTPNHTAMADYVSPENAFIVESSREWVHWPHDPRLVRRTFRYRINWKSLLDAYLASYEVAMNDPQQYASMSKASVLELKQHCSSKVIEEKLRMFFDFQRKVEITFDAKYFNGNPSLRKATRLRLKQYYYTGLLPRFVKLIIRKLFSLKIRKSIRKALRL